MVYHSEFVVASTLAFLEGSCQIGRWHGGGQEMLLTAAVVMSSGACLHLM